MRVVDRNRRTLSYTLFSADTYSSMPPENGLEFLSWLKGLISLVPKEYQKSITIEFSADSQYDVPHPELRVTWSRPETDEEMYARIQNEEVNLAALNERVRTEELKRLAELKAKYGQ